MHCVLGSLRTHYLRACGLRTAARYALTCLLCRLWVRSAGFVRNVPRPCCMRALLPAALLFAVHCLQTYWLLHMPHIAHRLPFTVVDLLLVQRTACYRTDVAAARCLYCGDWGLVTWDHTDGLRWWIRWATGGLHAAAPPTGRSVTPLVLHATAAPPHAAPLPDCRSCLVTLPCYITTLYHPRS